MIFSQVMMMRALSERSIWYACGIIKKSIPNRVARFFTEYADTTPTKLISKYAGVSPPPGGYKKSNIESLSSVIDLEKAEKIGSGGLLHQGRFGHATPITLPKVQIYFWNK